MPIFFLRCQAAVDADFRYVRFSSYFIIFAFFIFDFFFFQYY